MQWRTIRGHELRSNGGLTLPEHPLLGPGVGLQLGGADVDAHRARQVAHRLGHHRLGRVPRLQPGRLQPHVLALGGTHRETEGGGREGGGRGGGQQGPPTRRLHRRTLSSPYMVNGLHLYSDFIQSALQHRLTFTHSYTDGGVNHAR